MTYAELKAIGEYTNGQASFHKVSNSYKAIACTLENKGRNNNYV